MNLFVKQASRTTNCRQTQRRPLVVMRSSSFFLIWQTRSVSAIINVWKCHGSPPSKQCMVRAATFIFLRFAESVRSAGLARCSVNGCWPIIRCSPQSAFLCSARTQFARSFKLRVLLLVLSDGHRNVSFVAVMSAASDAPKLFFFHRQF